MRKVRIWDLPVRLFHWSLAILVVAAIVCEKIGGNAIVWHFRCGYAVLALVAFRILWGVAGTRYARFSSFVRGPSAVAEYARGLWNPAGRFQPGHNPLGALAVLALLGTLLAQATLGLWSNDDIANEGPLYKFISKALSDRLTWWHTEVGATLIYVLVGLHVAAIVFYRVRRRQDLVRPMLTGDAAVPDGATVEAAEDTPGRRLLALVLFALCAGGVYVIVNL